jgi:hypothetical protein
VPLAPSLQANNNARKPITLLRHLAQYTAFSAVVALGRLVGRYGTGTGANSEAEKYQKQKGFAWYMFHGYGL